MVKQVIAISPVGLAQRAGSDWAKNASAAAKGQSLWVRNLAIDEMFDLEAIVSRLPDYISGINSLIFTDPTPSLQPTNPNFGKESWRKKK